MDRKATDSIVTAIGIDIGKNIFLSIPKTKPDSIDGEVRPGNRSKPPVAIRPIT
jgi:hypothetical protein